MLKFSWTLQTCDIQLEGLDADAKGALDKLAGLSKWCKFAIRIVHYQGREARRIVCRS
jgi:hypothetical protein